MNKSYITARNLLMYLDSTRGVGHTTTMLQGAENTDCLVVGHNHDMYDILKTIMGGKKNIHFRSLSQVERDGLRGYRMPIVLDNAALYSLLSSLLFEMEKMRDENEMMANKIALIKNIVGQ
jgi:hypothetical protein